MEDFEFYTPTKVIFGKNAELQIGREIASRGYKKVLVHFGGTYLCETGEIDKIHRSRKMRDFPMSIWEAWYRIRDCLWQRKELTSVKKKELISFWEWEAEAP